MIPNNYRRESVRSAGISRDATLHLQLFRYAEDLQMLVDQHAELEQRHQHLQRSHEHLTESKDILENLIRCASDFYIITDGSGLIRFASTSADEKLTTAGSTLQGQSFRQLLAPFNRQGFDELLARLSYEPAGHHVEQWDFTVCMGGDTQRSLMVDAWVLPVTSDGKLQIYWIMRDISGRRTAEFETQMSSMVFRSAHEGIIITDIEGQIIAVNPAFTRITGYDQEEVIGKNPRMLSSGRQSKEFYREFWAKIIETGTWNGEMINRKKSGELYPEWITITAVRDDSGATLSYIAVFSDIARLVEAEKELSNLAYHDTLTGLPNRRLLEDRAEQALSNARRDGSVVSVMYLDLDRFKPVNDSLGHEIGDIVLQQISERMRAAMREGDTVARVGGDEFVILALGTGLQSDLEKIGDKVIEVLTAPILIGEHELLIGGSIGCAQFPKDGTDIATLLKNADNAMYAAKKMGGNHFCLFEKAMSGEHGLEKITMSTEIWHALERQQLHLVYQPQVASDGRNTLIGCEALLRWRHPVLGNISPSEFIPIAEKNGAIIPIGTWVLQQACQQLQRWKTKGIGNIAVSVNISARQLRNEDFVKTLASILTETGINPAMLELEVTESEIMTRPEEGSSCLLPLRALGVKIAIDDFGTGNFSLARLQNLPIDRLKIDQSFVRDIETDSDAQAISSCIVGMGIAMGLEVIAEGVENFEQLNRLNAQGCHLVQGYMIGRPMLPDIFLQWALEKERTDVTDKSIGDTQ
jgi:diguanylate cyclase (GGDEF)-like protein/PAS domain S-box-containing protein